MTYCKPCFNAKVQERWVKEQPRQDSNLHSSH